MSSITEPPPLTKYNVLNLGAGVQSSTLALMASKGEITPMPDFAVFADTQAEPQSVYDWLDWLEKELPFPVYRVTQGNLTEDSLKVSIKGEGVKNGKAGDTYIRRIIPVFGIKKDGKKTGAIGRKCTRDYKIRPILKKIRELCDIKHKQKNATVTQWIGISYDEIQRMKYPTHNWSQHRWPLIERKLTRKDCKEWMKANGYPEPPRSACYYCPFHSMEEWRNLKINEPEYFQKAVEFDKELREKFKKEDKTMEMEIYLHRSCKPLDEIDFGEDEGDDQLAFDFQAECDGMCGI